MQLELLSPAKNCDQGREAINHGADAVYIGAPAFGARVAAGNSIADIEALARYAHLYHAKVFATVNTLLFDEEVPEAVDLLHRLYEAGVDAAIIQDLGLLECDLPPIELHASTQTHNASLERVKFMEQVGFSRVILARETSLEQMQALRKATSIELEAFVQGALCVSYSGQCYMSQYLSGRSGNRGCCGQPCRSAYDLYDGEGRTLQHDRHLLSLKDFSATQHIQSMVDAGITSFKIEGRLKDMGYVKNVTAYYRRLLDSLMEGNGHRAASSGRCEFYCTPDLHKTFNRGFTDYFLKERKPMATLATQKSIGQYLGRIQKVEKNRLTLACREALTTGDGLCFFNTEGALEGFLVNQVQGSTLQPNRMPKGLTVGTEIWRNNDQAFEKQLAGRTSRRKIDVDIILSDTPDGLRLLMTDSDGCQGAAETACDKEPARNPAQATEQMVKQLGKLGDTAFSARHIESRCTETYHLPPSLLNELRRTAVTHLEEARITAHLATRKHSQPLSERQANTTPYHETEVDYRANVLNAQAETFYRRHGATVTEYGLERSGNYDGKALMTSKYCLRYELGYCLRKGGGTKSPEPWYLKNNKNWFRLAFDCRLCQMQVLLAPECPFESKD